MKQAIWLCSLQYVTFQFYFKAQIQAEVKLKVVFLNIQTLLCHLFKVKEKK